MTIIRLVYIYSSDGSLDPTFDNFNQALTTDIATALSIVVAVISFIKPFLDVIETGGLASKLRNPRSISTPKASKYMKLDYAKNVFSQQRTVSGGRTPLVTDAQAPSCFGGAPYKGFSTLFYRGLYKLNAASKPPAAGI